MTPLTPGDSNQPDSNDARSRAEEMRYGALAGRRRRPYALASARLTAVLFAAAVVLTLAVFANAQDWLPSGAPVLASGQPVAATPAEASRTTCAEIGTSNLRSPAEGVWYESNCLAAGEPVPIDCNRTTLDPVEFRSIAPGLFLFRQTQASPAYLWYGSTTECFSLVSSRLVTSVCADQTVTFEWDAGDACSGHGGVLALVNGR